jgi:hypothetical protein
VLGQDLGRLENPVRLLDAKHHDSLTLAEQIGQQAIIGHHHIGLAVGDLEPRASMTARGSLHSTLLDHPAQAHLAAVGRVLSQVGRRDEEHQVVAECRQGQARSGRKARTARQQDQQPLGLALHRLPRGSITERRRLATRSRKVVLTAKNNGTPRAST